MGVVSLFLCWCYKKIVKCCKFIILRNRNITLINLNKEFELNILVGMGCMELSFSLSCRQLSCIQLLNTSWNLWNFGLEHQIPWKFWYPSNPLWDLLTHQICWPDIMSEMDHISKVTYVIWNRNFTNESFWQIKLIVRFSFISANIIKI